MASLRTAAAAGARWTLASAAITIAAQFVQLGALARLLEPREFGLAASAMVVIGLAARIGDAGVSNAIIAKQTSDRNVLSSLYWANLILGGLACLAVIAIIPVATAYFHEPGLASLLLIAAPASLIAPLGQQYQALLQMELDFRPLASVDAVSAILAAAGAVALALAGVGAASLVGGYLIQTASRSLWLAVRGWPIAKPSWRLRREDLRGYLSFNAYQLGERVTTYLGSNLDYVLIGGFLGVRVLGTYSVAFRLISIPQLRLNPVLTRVAFPVLARRQHDDRALCRGFLELTRLVAFVSFPLLAGLAVTAPQLVPVAFGPQWTQSVAIIQVLAPLGMLFSLSNLNGSLFLAKDRPDLGLKFNVVRLVLIVAAFVPAVHVGVLAVAWAFLGVGGVMFVIGRLVFRRLIGLTWRGYGQALRQPAIATGVMVAGVAAATPALLALLDSDLSVLIVQAAIGAAVYAICTVVLARTWVLDTFRLVVKGRQPSPVVGLGTEVPGERVV